MSDAQSQSYREEREWWEELSLWEKQLSKSIELSNEYQNTLDEIDALRREYNRKNNELVFKLEDIKSKINAL